MPDRKRFFSIEVFPNGRSLVPCVLPPTSNAPRQYAHCQRKQCGNPEMAANLFSRLERFCEESQVMTAQWFSDNLHRIPNEMLRGNVHLGPIKH